ncbi:MAG: hypothetical protein FD172_2384, partial [Methylocystaceae bacterium]
MKRLLRGRRAEDNLLEAFADFLLLKLPADEDETRFELLSFFPFSLQIAVQDLMDALEHEPPRLVLEGDDSLAAQNIRNQIVQPRNESFRIDRAGVADRDGMHLVVMEMLHPGVRRVMIFMRMLMLMAMLMTVLMIMVVVIMAAIWSAFVIMAIIMIVTRLLGVEERRLNLQNSVEVEGVALQNRLQGNVRPHRAM